MTARDYLGGDCQRLAAAIQRVTGWPVALTDGAGSHITVMTPDGRHLDWMGIRTTDSIAAAWGATPERIGDIEDLGWLGCTPEVTDYQAAREALTRAGLLDASLAEDIDWRIEQLEDA